MADHDLTTTQGGQPSYNSTELLHFERVLDCSDIHGNGTNTTLASSDTAQLFDLPKNIWIIGVSAEVLTAEGGTATFDLGITGGDVDAYLDGVDANAAAGTVVVAGDAATDEPTAFSTNGKFLAAAETVSLLANNAMDAAVIRIIIKAMDMRGQLPTPA